MNFKTGTFRVTLTLVSVQAIRLSKVKYNLRVNTQLLIKQDNAISV